MGLLEEYSDFLKLILKSDVLKIGAVSVGIEVEKEGELVGTGRAINVGVDFFLDFFFEFILLREFGVVLLCLFGLFFELSFEPVEIGLNVSIVLFIVEMDTSKGFGPFCTICDGLGLASLNKFCLSFLGSASDGSFFFFVYVCD